MTCQDIKLANKMTECTTRFVRKLPFRVVPLSCLLLTNLLAEYSE